jgi:hypothetical protein
LITVYLIFFADEVTFVTGGEIFLIDLPKAVNKAFLEEMKTLSAKSLGEEI